MILVDHQKYVVFSFRLINNFQAYLWTGPQRRGVAFGKLHHCARSGAHACRRSQLRYDASIDTADGAGV